MMRTDARPGQALDRAADAAEQAVLSAIILAEHVAPDVAALLEPRMFAREAHRLLYRAMCAITTRGGPIDPVTLAAALNGDLARVGGLEYIATLIDVVPTVSHAAAHAQIVREHALRRQLVRVGAALADPALGAEQLAATIEELAALHQALRTGGPVAAEGPRLRSLAELLTDPAALAPPEAVIPRLAYRGRVTLVAGREKLGGKSTLLTAGAAAVTRGAGFLGNPCPVGPVLWVSADQEHAADLAARAVRFGAEPARFHVLWPRDPFTELTAAVARLTPAVVVIDTLASFAHGLVDDPHSSAQWAPVLLPLVRLARAHSTAVAIAHHAKKAEGGGYRDSTAIGALVDMLLELALDAANPSRRNVTVLGRWPAENFAVELVGDHYQVVAGAALGLEAQVLAFITAHPRCSKTKLRDGIGGKHHDVDAALSRLLASQAVRNAGTDTKHAYVTASQDKVEQIDLAPTTGLDDDDSDLPF